MLRFHAKLPLFLFQKWERGVTKSLAFFPPGAGVAGAGGLAGGFVQPWVAHLPAMNPDKALAGWMWKRGLADTGLDSGSAA